MASTIYVTLMKRGLSDDINVDCIIKKWLEILVDLIDFAEQLSFKDLGHFFVKKEDQTEANILDKYEHFFKETVSAWVF